MKTTQTNKQSGITLVELMVALAIGSFLIIGAVTIYNQSRQAYVVNESIARVQEIAQFAMDQIETDLRMASNWGRNSRGLAVEGRSVGGVANPNGLAAPAACGAGWALNLALPIDGENNGYNLACPAVGAANNQSDVITVRRASVAPAPAVTNQRMQIQSTRIQGELFIANAIPTGFSPADSATHNLLVSSYYVSPSSQLINGIPTLRRKRLIGSAAGPTIVDEELAPGVENIQLQLGIDVDQDNTVDRYVNPGDPIYDPDAVGFVPGARVITARVWMLVRGLEFEDGIQDNRNYAPGDVPLGTFNDNFRRMQVSKTILLRNART